MISSSAKRFAKRLAAAITELTGEPCTCDAGDLHAATGWYRSSIQADVMRWTGSVTLNGFIKSVGSWEPMSSALKHGFQIEDGRHDSRAYCDFEISVPEYVHPFHQRQDARLLRDANSHYSSVQLAEMSA